MARMEIMMVLINFAELFTAVFFIPGFQSVTMIFPDPESGHIFM
jgi:hypothetical protein